MAKQKKKEECRYVVEKNGQRIVKITGHDSRVARRVIFDFHKKPLKKFDMELFLKKLKSLQKRHDLYSMFIFAFTYGFFVRAVLAL